MYVYFYRSQFQLLKVKLLLPLSNLYVQKPLIKSICVNATPLRQRKVHWFPIMVKQIEKLGVIIIMQVWTDL